MHRLRSSVGSGSAQALQRGGIVVLWALLVALACFASGGAEARGRGFDRGQDLATIRVAELPPEGRDMLARIHAGGPFGSSRDGVVFANRERLLPSHPRGYYAEYTVPTPGARTRGARRIIAGRGSSDDFRTSGEYYYTDDHYNSFRQIVK